MYVIICECIADTERKREMYAEAIHGLWRRIKIAFFVALYCLVAAIVFIGWGTSYTSNATDAAWIGTIAFVGCVYCGFEVLAAKRYAYEQQRLNPSKEPQKSDATVLRRLTIQVRTVACAVTELIVPA